MIGINILVIYLMIYKAVIVTANTSTTGSYFKELLDVEKTEKCMKNDDFTFADDEIFKCQRTNECNYVGKMKGWQKYRIVDASEMENSGKYCSIMKKININDETKVLENNPADCKEAYNRGIKNDGTVIISLKNSENVKVYCDMTTDGGGWTVFQRRLDNMTSFERNWLEYENGFGSMEGNFWIGLKTLHQITGKTGFILRIDLADNNGNWGYAEYNGFYIDGPEEKYRLHLGQLIKGNIGDSLQISNNMKFTTYDDDNDANSEKNCAAVYSGGWWYNACFHANLNGLHYDVFPAPNTRLKKMSWFTWSSDMGTITYSEMKFKAMATLAVTELKLL